MSKVPSVLFVTVSHKIGGGTKVLMTVIERMRGRFRPIVVTPGEGPVADWARAERVALRFVKSTPGGQAAGRAVMYRQAPQMLRILVSDSVDLVHTESPMCHRPVSTAARLLRIPRICHLGFPPQPGELKWNLSSGAELVIACYEGQAREVSAELARVSPRTALTAVPNGVDVRHFQPRTAGDSNWERWRFGARHVVVIVGHLSEVKGYPAFVRAAARVQATVGDCTFIAVGGETIQVGFKATLLAMAAELGIAERLHFVGWQSDIADILKAADVLALPSLDEGLPLAILEGMAAGLPVVATPVGGVPEAVVDGETGFLVPPDDSEALASALVRVLQNPELAARMGAAARERAQRDFSLDRCAEKILGLYDQLLAAKDGR